MDKKELRRYVTRFIYDCFQGLEIIESENTEWYAFALLEGAQERLEEEAEKRINNNPEKLIKDMCEFWKVDSLIVIDPDKRSESEYEVVWVKPKEIK